MSTVQETFKDQEKLRKAKITNPPNIIKAKIGTGGLDKETLAKAEQVIKENTIDFKPIAAELFSDLDKAIEQARSNTAQNEATIEALLYPAAQFKAQGGMFRYPLVSEIGDILVNFLETIPLPVFPDALEIVTAHRKAISAVIMLNMTGDAKTAQGEELKKSLIDACSRYYKSRKT